MSRGHVGPGVLNTVAQSKALMSCVWEACGNTCPSNEHRVAFDPRNHLRLGPLRLLDREDKGIIVNVRAQQERSKDATSGPYNYNTLSPVHVRTDVGYGLVTGDRRVVQVHRQDSN
jgi:hypothetical protein